VIDLIGGAGFIGTRLAGRLQRRAEPFLLIDKAPSFRFPERHRFADVRDGDSLRATMSGGTVVNLAAEHRDDVRPLSLYEDVNVQGARNVCEVATEKGVRCIVFTSTVAVYGFAPPNTDESGAINPFNEYGRTKWGAEQVYREWYEADPANRTLVILRPTVVFGEQNRGNVYNLLRQIASGRFVMVGSGRNVKSMAYVENIAAFLEYSLSFAPGLYVYNYVDKPDFDMNALVATVRERLGAAKGVGFRLPYTWGWGRDTPSIWRLGSRSDRFRSAASGFGSSARQHSLQPRSRRRGLSPLCRCKRDSSARCSMSSWKTTVMNMCSLASESVSWRCLDWVRCSLSPTLPSAKAGRAGQTLDDDLKGTKCHLRSFQNCPRAGAFRHGRLALDRGKQCSSDADAGLARLASCDRGNALLQPGRLH
jgi:GlcNAc-P-P-Und epimerase